MVRILLVVYALAINVYNFILVKAQRDQVSEGQCSNAVNDGKILMIALLGGALGAYVSTFILKYRLKSMFFMVLLPVITVVNAYFIISGFMGNFWLIHN